MSDETKVAMRCANPTCAFHDIKVRVPEETECIGCQQKLVHVVDTDLINKVFGPGASDMLKDMGL